ncbi:hypothetical protein DRA43_30970, partial [Micromonospora provocatoris]
LTVTLPLVADASSCTEAVGSWVTRTSVSPDVAGRVRLSHHRVRPRSRDVRDRPAGRRWLSGC